MNCPQCGARRGPTGPCRSCGAPAPGSRSGVGWGGSGRREPDWDDQQAGGRPSSRRRESGPDDYEVDLERALVPTRGGGLMPGGGALPPAVPGMPGSEEEERAMGMRRPVYIPAESEKRKRRAAPMRIAIGIASLLVVCVAACGLSTFLLKDRINAVLGHPIQTTPAAVSFDFKNVPVTPVSTPGAGAKYIVSAITAKKIDTNLAPIDVTSHFNVNNTVYVVVQVRNVPKGETHTVSIRWFMQGQEVFGVTSNNAQLSKPVTQDSNTYFGLQVPQPGEGYAKIYWDRPASAQGDSADAQSLAQTIYFAVAQPTPTPAVSPAASPSVSPVAH
jgi:hypothetical protein